MTPEQATALGVLIARQDTQRRSLQASVALLMRRSWRRTMADRNAAYRPTASRALAAELAALSRQGQRQSAGLTVGFLRAALGVLGVSSRQLRAPALPLDIRGVPTEEVYERPATRVRYYDSLDRADEALDLGLLRLDQLVDADLQKAAVFAETEALSPVSSVVGWRRVLRPEMPNPRTGIAGPVCGLCVAASDRLYDRGNLRPIHGNCRCTVAPVLDNGEDPGQELNRDDLAELYAAAGGTTDQRALKRVRFQITQHSELGPVLSAAADKVRTAEQAERDRRTAVRLAS